MRQWQPGPNTGMLQTATARQQECMAGCFSMLAEVQLDSPCAVRLLAPSREVLAQLQAVCAGHLPAMLAAATAAEAAAAGAPGTGELAHDTGDVGLGIDSRTVLAQAVLLAVALQPEAAHPSYLAVLERLSPAARGENLRKHQLPLAPTCPLHHA